MSNKVSRIAKNKWEISIKSFIGSIVQTAGVITETPEEEIYKYLVNLHKEMKCNKNQTNVRQIFKKAYKYFQTREDTDAMIPFVVLLTDISNKFPPRVTLFVNDKAVELNSSKFETGIVAQFNNDNPTINIEQLFDDYDDYKSVGEE